MGERVHLITKSETPNWQKTLARAARDILPGQSPEEERLAEEWAAREAGITVDELRRIRRKKEESEHAPANN